MIEADRVRSCVESTLWVRDPVDDVERVLEPGPGLAKLHTRGDVREHDAEPVDVVEGLVEAVS